MAKIVKISGELVLIGQEDNSLLEVTKSMLDFDPVVGEEVDVFKSETQVLVSKKVQKSTEASKIDSESGINININNSNENASNGYGYVSANGKIVGKVPYIILAMLLGGLGGHKFYSGKIGVGILYLLFCWTYIPAAIGLIEGIIAIFKTPDINGNIVV